MIRRPPRSTLDRSSAASDVYKRQGVFGDIDGLVKSLQNNTADPFSIMDYVGLPRVTSVSYTHLRAHETVLDLVCRLLLEKKKKKNENSTH